MNYLLAEMISIMASVQSEGFKAGGLVQQSTKIVDKYISIHFIQKNFSFCRYR